MSKQVRQPKDQLFAFADVGYEAVACDWLKTSALTALDYSVDWPEGEHGTNWGLCVANRESRFKVLDVYEHEGKTQIELLHLLDDDRWRIFANAEFDMPGLGIEDTRARFEARCSQEPIPELSTEVLEVFGIERPLSRRGCPCDTRLLNRAAGR